jgi:predicted PurR-regulated permease PerM
VPSAAGIVAGASIVAVCVLLFAVSEALPVFLIGLITAFVLDPPVTWLASHRVPRGLATLIALVVTAIVAGAGRAVPRDRGQPGAAFIAGLPEAFAQLEAWVASLNLAPTVEEDILNFLRSVEEAAANFDVTSLFDELLGGLFAILGSFFTLLTLPFFLFYVLAGRPTIARQVREVLPTPWRDDVLQVIAILLNSFATYVRAEAIVMTILGAMTFVGIMLLSVLVDPAFAEFALLLAIIAAISELIPNFGP